MHLKICKTEKCLFTLLFIYLLKLKHSQLFICDNHVKASSHFPPVPDFLDGTECPFRAFHNVHEKKSGVWKEMKK